MGGAFVGLEKIVSQRAGSANLGFGADVKAKSDKLNNERIKDIQPHDLIKYGMIPEFVGRVPIVVSLEGLNQTALERILQEPKNAILKQYKKMFKMDGIELEFSESAIKAVAQKAIELRTGARGLRTILEDKMIDVMYNYHFDEEIDKIVVDDDFIMDKAAPKNCKKTKNLKQHNI